MIYIKWYNTKVYYFKNYLGTLKFADITKIFKKRNHLKRQKLKIGQCNINCVWAEPTYSFCHQILISRPLYLSNFDIIDWKIENNFRYIRWRKSYADKLIKSVWYKKWWITYKQSYGKLMVSMVSMIFSRLIYIFTSLTHFKQQVKKVFYLLEWPDA